MSPQRPFYGWAVVAGVFVMLTVSSGLGFYALTLYLRTLTTERGFSVSSISGATAVFFVTAGLAGVVVGKLIDRLDPRPVIAVGAVVCAAAVLGLARVTTLWQVHATYALFGAGFACCSLVPATTLVTRWFHRRRSVALSIASTGLSLGGIALTPAAAALLARRGLPGAAPWLAAGFVAGIVPATAALLRPSPTAMGLAPDGEPLGAGGPAAPGGVPYAEAVRTPLFRAITTTWTVGLLAQVGAIAHLFSVADERAGRTTAALAVSVMAACSLAGRLAGGLVLQRTSLRRFAVAVLAVQGMGLLALAVSAGAPAVLAAAALFGLAVGNVLLLHPVVVAEVFGVRDYARIFSLSQLVAGVGLAAGPFLLGLLRDATGGYGPAFAAAAALSATATATLATAGPLDGVHPEVGNLS